VTDLLSRCDPKRDFTPECLEAIQCGNCERIEFQRDAILGLLAESLNDLVNDCYKPETIKGDPKID
jgi:hypothetical protein